MPEKKKINKNFKDKCVYKKREVKSLILVPDALSKDEKPLIDI